MADSVWVAGESSGNTLQNVVYFNSLVGAVAYVKTISTTQDNNYQIVRIEDNLDGILVTASGGELAIDLGAGGTGGFGSQGEGG